MLAVSPFRDENQREVLEDFSIGDDDFPEFEDGNLLDNIDFDDLFTNINDGDILPDLEMDPADILANFSATSTVGEESEFNNTSVSIEDKNIEEEINNGKKDDHEDEKVSISRSGLNPSSTSSTNTPPPPPPPPSRVDQEILSNKIEETATAVNSTSKVANNNKGKKSSSSSSTAQFKNSQGKRKVKVDWTPELHRRFVQAVDQLGVDKAVPSRILELMGIDCLTRHNIASHLQKYRSHKKHLLAREAEAVSLNQRRQMYGAAGTGGVMRKRDIINPWIAPTTICFPTPVTPIHPHFRPLHVWGHPTHVDQSLMHWPNNLPHSPSPVPLPPTTWPPTLPPRPDHSYWHHQRVPNALNPGTSCFPQPLATTICRYATPPVPGIPPPLHGMYKVVPPAQSGPHPLLDFQPSKESIDAAIGDVMSKPWLPLPLGLKPPSLDSVMGELHRQGVPKVPPSSINA